MADKLEKWQALKTKRERAGKDFLDILAQRMPFVVHIELYPKLRKRFNIPDQIVSRNQIAETLEKVAGEFRARGIPASAPPYPSCEVEIPSKFFHKNRDKVLDVLDEITGVKHRR